MTKPKTTTPPSRDKVTYLIAYRNGDVQKVTVPAKWKVTLGGMMGIRNQSGDQRITLRFYEGTMQRACIQDVISFWDAELNFNTAAEYEGLQKLTGKKLQAGMPLALAEELPGF